VTALGHRADEPQRVLVYGWAILHDKNDLWIAATTLLSTDKSAFHPLRDSNHLNVVLLDPKTGLRDRQVPTRRPFNAALGIFPSPLSGALRGSASIASYVVTSIFFVSASRKPGSSPRK
jgi:hypothetical protein